MQAPVLLNSTSMQKTLLPYFFPQPSTRLPTRYIARPRSSFNKPIAVPALQLSVRRRVVKSVEVSATAESTAVETLPTTGPPSHGISLDEPDETIVEPTEEGSSTFNQALCNAVNILLGVGLLSIPFALKEGGWASLGVLAAIWTGTNYTGKILIKCQEIDLRKGKRSGGQGLRRLLTTYEDVGERAFGIRGRQFITAVLYAELIGTCALFFILEGDHLHFLLTQLMEPFQNVPSKEQLMAMSAGLFIPTTWLPDVGMLSSIGLLGMLSAVGLTGIVGYELIQHGANFADTIPVNMSTLPGSFGLLAFVFAGHAVFPSIYSSMKDKTQFPKMLDISYVIVGATCLLMGVAGYLLYGDQTLEEVTLNLPTGLLSLIATSLILVSPFAKFGLTLEPVAKGIEEKLNLSMKGSTANLARLNRTALGCGCLFLATQIPFFGQFMSVVGSFLTLTISVIFPSCCYMKLYGDDLKSSEKLMNYSVVSLGVACAISGTWTAVNEVIKQIN